MNASLKNNGYYLIKNFIPKEQAEELAEKFKSYTERKNVTGDEQAPNSSSLYNYWPFLELQMQKINEVAKICEEPLLPTYTYARVYKNSDTLHSHKDRDACEISLTIHLDGDKEWPIWFDCGNGFVENFFLEKGDAILYLGREKTHWRTSYEGKEYVQLFLHYVRSRGECSYTAFDKARTLEEACNDSYYDLLPAFESVIPRQDASLKEYIYTYDNLLPKDLCEKIIKEYESCDEWSLAGIGYDDQDNTIRNCDTIFISSEEVISKNRDLRSAIDSEIFECVSKAIKRYSCIHNHLNIVKDSGYQLLRYNPGQFYIEHVDSYDKHPRSISCSIQLNDDYTGGELSFFYNSLTPESKAGSAIMFPSNFMYPHQITPVKSGTRYSIITWFI